MYENENVVIPKWLISKWMLATAFLEEGEYSCFVCEAIHLICDGKKTDFSEHLDASLNALLDLLEYDLIECGVIPKPIENEEENEKEI